jgi:hypothetical protein
LGEQILRNTCISTTEFINPPRHLHRYFFISSSTRYYFHTYKISETLTAWNFNKFIFRPNLVIACLLSPRPPCYHSNTQFASFERLCLKCKDYASVYTSKTIPVSHQFVSRHCEDLLIFSLLFLYNCREPP